MNGKFNKEYFKTRDIFGAGGILGKLGWYLSYTLRITTYKIILKKIRSHTHINSLLEVGCGLGYAATTFHHYLSGNTVALDISEFSTIICQNNNLLTTLMTAEHLGFRPSSFDAITSFDVIEHLTQPEKFVKNSYIILKPGGILVISTPNPNAYALHILKNSWHGFLDNTHVSIKNFEEWTKIFRKEGFILIETFSDSLFYLINRDKKIIFIKKLLKYFPWYLMGIFSQILSYVKPLPPIGENIYYILQKPVKNHYDHR